MPLLDENALRGRLLLTAARNGAPGGLIANTGINPVQELLFSYAEAVVPLLNTYAPLQSWVLLPPATPYSGTIPLPPQTDSAIGPGPIVQPLSALITPRRIALAQSKAAELGWTGPHRASLLRTIYDGLYSALSETRSKLAVTIPTITYAPGLILSYQHLIPLPSLVLSGAINGRFLANPNLGTQGDPSRRVALAKAFADITAEVWRSVTPTFPIVGTPGSVTIPPSPIPAAVVP